MELPYCGVYVCQSISNLCTAAEPTEIVDISAPGLGIGEAQSTIDFECRYIPATNSTVIELQPDLAQRTQVQRRVMGYVPSKITNDMFTPGKLKQFELVGHKTVLLSNPKTLLDLTTRSSTPVSVDGKVGTQDSSLHPLRLLFDVPRYFIASS